MASKEHTLEDLFLETLKDIYSAEKIIMRALPRMAKAANSNELRQAFEHHRDETEAQVERLEEVFGLMEKPARGKTCEALQGIVDEAKEVMDEFKGSDALDAGLLASAHPKWERIRERRKAQRLLRLAETLPRIRRAATSHLASQAVILRSLPLSSLS